MPSTGLARKPLTSKACSRSRCCGLAALKVNVRLRLLRARTHTGTAGGSDIGSGPELMLPYADRISWLPRRGEYWYHSLGFVGVESSCADFGVSYSPLVFDQFLTYKLFLTLALLFDTYVVDR